MKSLTETQKAALLAGIISFGVGVAVGNGLPWYGSEEECLLREAKEMPRDSLNFVRRYCLEKFPPAYEAPPAEAPAEEAPAPEAAPLP